VTSPGRSLTWIDFGYMKRRIDVPESVIQDGEVYWMKWTNLTLYNVRSPIQHQAPGLDFVGVSFTSLCILEDVFMVYDVCIPNAILAKYATTVPRPQQVPALNGSKGLQVVGMWPEPYCWPDPAGQVCYNGTVHMEDYAVVGSRVEGVGVRNNVGGLVLNLNTSFACKDYVKPQCLAATPTTFPCVAAWVDTNHLAWADAYDSPSVYGDAPSPSPQPPGTPPQVAAPGGSGSDERARNVRIGVGVGVGVGVVVLALAVTVLAMWAVKKRKQKHEQAELDKYYKDTHQDTAHFSDCMTSGTCPASEGAASSVLVTIKAGAGSGGVDHASDVITGATPIPCEVPLELDVAREVDIQSDCFIGAGAFGKVYGCVYNGQRCAIKVAHQGVVAPESKAHLATLRKEVEIMARCSHPNIVRILAANLVPPNVCVVQELLATSLRDVVHDAKADLDLLRVLAIARDIAAGLAYLHPTVMHRDLKPANVLLTDKGVAKLADFGLARLRLTSTMGTLNTNNPASGTTQYMAPECFDESKHKVTHKSDIYSLGVIIWEMLVRKQPWTGQSFVRVMYLVTVAKERLPLPQDARCPRQLRKLVEECWDADPQRRPSAAEVQKRLTVMMSRELQRQGLAPAGSASSGVSPMALKPSEAGAPGPASTAGSRSGLHHEASTASTQATNTTGTTTVAAPPSPTPASLAGKK